MSYLLNTEFSEFLVVKLRVQIKKVSFTACHSGKLYLVCTCPKVISTSLKKKLMSRIDYSSSVIWIPPKKSLTDRASYEQNSLAR